MKLRKHEQIRNNIDRLLRIRLRVYFIIYLLTLSMIIVDIFRGKISLGLAIVGILFGVLLGIIVSRTSRLSWDQEILKVTTNIDWIGGIIIIAYFVFMLGRDWFFGHWVQSTTLTVFGVSILVGTMFGRIFGIRRGIGKTLKTLGVLKPSVTTMGKQ